MIVILYRLADEYRHLNEQISDLEDEMNALVSNDDRGRRLLEVHGSVCSNLNEFKQGLIGY